MLTIARPSHAGDNKLIIMTPTFDVLSEKLLHTSDFGSGRSSSGMPPPLLSLTSCRCASQRWLGFKRDTIPRLARKSRQNTYH
jgi:hypothetical protein